jgi:hypothetical protein
MGSIGSRLFVALMATISTLLFVVGGIGVAASIYDWDWFFEAGGADWLVRRIGRDRARVICAALGMTMVTIALIRATGVVRAPGG